MGDVIQATFGRKPEDGGKARIRRRREALGIDAAAILNSLDAFHFPDDLAMDHADVEMPCDVAFCAPDTDLA